MSRDDSAAALTEEAQDLLTPHLFLNAATYERGAAQLTYSQAEAPSGSRDAAQHAHTGGWRVCYLPALPSGGASGVPFQNDCSFAHRSREVSARPADA